MADVKPTYFDPITNDTRQVDPSADTIAASGYKIGTGDHFITLDGSNNIVFKDGNVGQKTLSDVYARSSKNLTQHLFHNAAGSTLLSRSNELEYNLSNITSTGDSIIDPQDDSANARTKFVALKKCTVHISVWVQESDTTTTQTLQVFKNGLSGGTQMLQSHSHPSNGTETGLAVAGSFTLDAGEFFTIRFFQDVANNSDFAFLSVVAQADEFERIENVDAVENVFSARIANNGTASVTSQSSDFIQSVSRTSAGRVTVTFNSSFFSVIPSIIAIGNAAGNVNAEIRSASTSSVEVATFTANSAADVDSAFELIVQRQGADYTSIQDVIVSFPIVKFQTKYLSANATADGVMSDLTFSNLTVGKAYELNFQAKMRVNQSNAFDAAIQIDINNGSQLLAVPYLFCSATNDPDILIREGGSVKFIATGTTVTFTAVSASATSLIVGNGTASGTYAQLAELPNHEQTTQW